MISVYELFTPEILFAGYILKFNPQLLRVLTYQKGHLSNVSRR